MKSIIGVYDSHEKAVAALQELKAKGYPEKLLSLFGKADIVDGHVQVKSQHSGSTYLSIGIAAAVILEAVAVIGIFAVPGFGFLFGTAATVGGFAGLSTALLEGGDVKAIFTGKDINDADAMQYEKDLSEGKFLVFADGDDSQLEQARHILQK